MSFSRAFAVLREVAWCLSKVVVMLNYVCLISLTVAFGKVCVDLHCAGAYF